MRDEHGNVIPAPGTGPHLPDDQPQEPAPVPPRRPGRTKPVDPDDPDGDTSPVDDPEPKTSRRR